MRSATRKLRRYKARRGGLMDEADHVRVLEGRLIAIARLLNSTARDCDGSGEWEAVMVHIEKAIRRVELQRAGRKTWRYHREPEGRPCRG